MQTTITPATITEHHKQLTHAQVGRKILSLNPLFINSSNLNMKKLLLAISLTLSFGQKLEPIDVAIQDLETIIQTASRADQRVIVEDFTGLL